MFLMNWTLNSDNFLFSFVNYIPFDLHANKILVQTFSDQKVARWNPESLPTQGIIIMALCYVWKSSYKCLNIIFAGGDVFVLQTA